MRPRMHGERRARQHHAVIARRGRIGQLGADPGRGVHVDSAREAPSSVSSSNYAQLDKAKGKAGSRGVFDVPVNTSPGHARSDPSRCEAALFEHARVPGLEARGA